MIWIFLNGLMMLFAFGSGVSKVVGISSERNVAEQLGIDYKLITFMGVLQLLSIPFVYFKYYFVVVLLLGFPYLFIVYLGSRHEQYMLSVFSFIIFSITVASWLASSVI